MLEDYIELVARVVTGEILPKESKIEILNGWLTKLDDVQLYLPLNNDQLILSVKIQDIINKAIKELTE